MLYLSLITPCFKLFYVHQFINLASGDALYARMYWLKPSLAVVWLCWWCNIITTNTDIYYYEAVTSLYINVGAGDVGSMARNGL